MNTKEDNVIFNIKYLFVSIILNILFVSVHEIGHASVYTLQGYKVAFHFTNAHPVNGIKTLLGASGGLLFNVLFALIFLILLLKYKNIYLFSVISANTLFARISLYILTLLKGITLNDETFIGNVLRIDPVVISLVGLVAMAYIFLFATKILFKTYSKNYSKLILMLTFIGCIISLFIVIPLDSKGL